VVVGDHPRRSRQRMTEAEIRSIVDKLADIARVLRDADLNDKSEIFRQLGLKLTYHPGRRLVEAKIEPAKYGFFRQCPRGDTHLTYMIDIALTTEFSLITIGAL
jgi:hypothetical protein